MRWVEPVPDGQRTWYIAALRPDASFWGYVHVRTSTLNENRSFDGRIALTDNDQIRSMIDSVRTHASVVNESGKLDGLIGLGTHSDFQTIMQYNCETSTTPNAELFRAIVDILQPVVTSAVNLDEH